MTPTYTAAQNKTKTVNPPSPCGCGCQDSTHAAGCCGLTCFERPYYFCGHLLTEADLTLEQKYVREKNKLYHRTLHGHGVVCGLRLTCDPGCCGQIKVGDGYAIDDCGNDLVVCEPIPIDVLALARAKGWLIDAQQDPCKKEDDPECTIKQCFYITLCYTEEQAEFTTPFKNSGGPSPADCQPTRVREKVTFDLLDELPERESPLEELEERIRCCFRIFTDGPLARGLTQHVPTAIGVMRGEALNRDPYETFYQIKTLFRRYLEKCPDLYNCKLEREVCDLQCIKEQDPANQNLDHLRQCYERLFRLIQQYVFDCVLGQLVFPCPAPPKASCVVLGTVQVEDGCITRVCNCPREYVWSPANFIEVLTYYVLEGAACEQTSSTSFGTRIDREPNNERQPEPVEDDGECCGKFNIELLKFLYLFQAEPKSSEYAATSFTGAFRSLLSTTRSAFNGFDSSVISPRVFAGMDLSKASELAKNLGFELTPIAQPQEFAGFDLVSSILTNVLKRPGDPMAALTTTQNQKAVITTPVRELDVPVRLDLQLQSTQISDLQSSHDAVKARVDSLPTKEEMQKKIDELTKRLLDLENKVNSPTPPSAPSGAPAAPHAVSPAIAAPAPAAPTPAPASPESASPGTEPAAPAASPPPPAPEPPAPSAPPAPPPEGGESPH